MGTSTPGSLYGQVMELARTHDLFRPQDTKFYIEAGATLAAVAFIVTMTIIATELWQIVILASLMGMSSTRFAILDHDIIHGQAPRRHRALRKPLVFLFGNIAIGMSHSWWADKHNAHHKNPNVLGADPDIDSRYITYSREQLSDRNRLQRLLAHVQPITFLLLIPLQAISFREGSIRFLVNNWSTRSAIELVGIGLHFATYAFLLFLIGDWQHALVFALVHQAVFGVYNSLIFAPNHKGMPNLERGTDPFILQVTTASNVEGGWFFGWLTGGLNHQIEHHVAPRMSRYQLSEFRQLLKPFCDEQGVSYRETGVWGAYAFSLGSLWLHASTTED